MKNNLFNKEEVHKFLNKRKSELKQKIKNLSIEKLESFSLEELEEKLYKEYILESPELKSSDIYLSEEPQEINGENKIKFTICIPFKGKGLFFGVRPSRFRKSYGSLNEPKNQIVEKDKIKLTYIIKASNQEDFNPKSIYKKNIERIEHNLKMLKNDFKAFNNSLTSLIKKELKNRRDNAEAKKKMIESFDLPIKKRKNTPKTYDIPKIREKTQLKKASKNNKKTETYTPEPTLPDSKYESILTTIKSMSLAIERSPKTFSELQEEEIRDFFLILLNGHYEYDATGETFNGEGKTDILLKYNDENAFIAECKFWRGEKKMEEAINQLLSYITWRDTKTSIILFNKKKTLSLSNIIEKAQGVIENHNKYKSAVSFKSKKLKKSSSAFKYKFVHPSDSEKDFFITLMGFQIRTNQ